MTAPIDISAEALEAFRSRLRKDPPLPKAVRLGLRGGGCSGYSYAIELDYDPIRPGDVEWRPDGWDGEASFRVDKKSLSLLSGSRLGYKKTVMGEGFEFENPREASKCGCGASFTVR